MSKLYYVAVVERAADGFGAFFPDLPGCIGAGDTVQAALANAESALALHIAGMREDGDRLPVPSAPDTIAADPEVDEVARAMLGVATDHAKVRINVMMDAKLLAAIDSVAANRSQFLSDAARQRLEIRG